MMKKLITAIALLAMNLSLMAKPKDLAPVLAEAVAVDNDKLVIEVPISVWENISSKGKVPIKDVRVTVKNAKLTLNRLKYPVASAIAGNARNRVMDLKGNIISPEDVIKTFKNKKQVLLSLSGNYPDKFYLDAYKDDILVVVPGIIETGFMPDLMPREATDKDSIVGSWVNEAGISWTFRENNQLILATADGRLIDVYTYELEIEKGHLNLIKDNKAQTLLCLYQFKDGKLKICQSTEIGDYRPAHINESSERSDNCILKRAK